jgi:glycosyltransferase 2 family protein
MGFASLSPGHAATAAPSTPKVVSVTGHTRSVIVLVLAALGTLGFGYLSVRNVHLGQMWRALRHSNYWWTIPSVALTAVAVAIRVQRWRFLFRSQRRPPFTVAARALLISYFFNNVLPARAGEFARIVDLKRRAGISRAETAATVILERLYDVIVLGVLLFAFLPWLPRLTWLRSVELFMGVVVCGFVAAILALAIFGEGPVQLALKPLKRFGLSTARADAVASSVGHGLAAIREARVAVVVILWTAVSWLVAAGSAWVLMIGFHLHLPFAAAIVVVVAVNLAQVLPSLPSGLGVVEAAAVLALGAYDIGSTRGLAYALVYHALNFIPFVAAGPFVLGRGLNWRRSRIARSNA